MKESEFQAWIVEVAQRLGWRCYHAPTPMRPVGGNKFVPDRRGRGLPDLFLLHDDPPRIIFAEVKNEKGTLDPAQVEFLKLARDVAQAAQGFHGFDAEGVPHQYRPVGAFVWRPANRELIEATLRGALLTPA